MRPGFRLIIPFVETIQVVDIRVKLQYSVARNNEINAL
jgi:hypothetical protein